jgi:P4 family phage/plasmid primase-like protien
LETKIEKYFSGSGITKNIHWKEKKNKNRLKKFFFLEKMTMKRSIYENDLIRKYCHQDGRTTFTHILSNSNLSFSIPEENVINFYEEYMDYKGKDNGYLCEIRHNDCIMNDNKNKSPVCIDMIITTNDGYDPEFETIINKICQHIHNITIDKSNVIITLQAENKDDDDDELNGKFYGVRFCLPLLKLTRYENISVMNTVMTKCQEYLNDKTDELGVSFKFSVPNTVALIGSQDIYENNIHIAYNCPKIYSPDTKKRVKLVKTDIDDPFSDYFIYPLKQINRSREVEWMTKMNTKGKQPMLYVLSAYYPTMYDKIQSVETPVMNEFEIDVPTEKDDNPTTPAEEEKPIEVPFHVKYEKMTSGIQGDIADMFYEDMKDDVKTSYDVFGNFFICIWDNQDKLWKINKNTGQLTQSILNWGKKVHNDVNIELDRIKAKYSREHPEFCKAFALGKKYNELYKKLGTLSTCKAIAEIVAGKRNQTYFMDRLNIEQKTLLPIKNGKIINLATGEVRERTKTDLFSYESPVEYLVKDKYEEAEKYMLTLCCGDVGLMAVLQVLFGYIITGMNNQKIIPIITGGGDNGKSTLCLLIKEILGKNFATPANKKCFIQTRDTSAHNAEFISLMGGYRFTYLSETKEDDVLRDEEIKKMVGDDTVKIRACGGKEEVEVRFQCKCLIATNHIPKFKKDDRTLTDKILAIPFNHTFPKDRTKTMDEIIEPLKNEMFSWIVQGAIRFLKDKKIDTEYPALVEAKEKFLHHNDFLEDFLKDRCIVDPKPDGMSSADYSKTRIDSDKWFERSRLWKEWREYVDEMDDPDLRKIKRSTLYMSVKAKFGDVYKVSSEYYRGFRLRHKYDGNQQCHRDPYSKEEEDEMRTNNAQLNHTLRTAQSKFGNEISIVPYLPPN